MDTSKVLSVVGDVYANRVRNSPSLMFFMHTFYLYPTVRFRYDILHLVLRSS